MYTRHIESILVLRARTVGAVPTDEILRVLAVLAVQNPEICEVQGVCTVTNPEILRVRKYPQYLTSKYCEYSAVHKPEAIRVHEVPAVFFSKILHSQVLVASVEYYIILYVLAVLEYARQVWYAVRVRLEYRMMAINKNNQLSS